MHSKLLKCLGLGLFALLGNVGASPLFQDDRILEIQLMGPLGRLIETSDEEQELPFLIRANNVYHAVDVRPRGKSRRRVCDIPPMRFNFRSAGTKGTAFENQDKLKFVTHCKDDAASRIDVLEEYAVYRIFSLLSDVSYRVRLLRAEFIDTDHLQDDKSFAGYGFLIEPAAALAERVGGKAVAAEGVILGTLNARQAATVYIFQYLVGNTDWSLVKADEDDTCCHNGDLFDIGSDRYYVPYDFDLTGFVNARYAKPDPSLRMSSVRLRRYRGYCIGAEALQAALVDIKARKQDIFDVVRGLPALSPKEIAVKVEYLEGFFEKTDDEVRLISRFDRKCL